MTRPPHPTPTPFAAEDGGFHILAISGGGFRGLFAAQILAHLEEELGAPLAKKFDLIAGTSIGGILALAVAAEIPMSRVVALFTDHGEDIFAPTVFGLRRPRWLADRLNLGLWSSKYANKPLQQLLAAPELFGERTLGELAHRVLVPAVNVTKGGPCMFKTPHHVNWKSDWKHRLVDVALATSAAPTFFPIHEFNDVRYADGGLVANAPGLPALHEAVRFLDVPQSRVRLVAVGTAAPGVAFNAAHASDMGLLFGRATGEVAFWRRLWPVAGWGRRLFGLTIASQEQMSHQMLAHWLQEAYHHIDDPVPFEAAMNVGLDRAGRNAQKTLRGHAANAIQAQVTPTLLDLLRAHQPAPATFHYGPHQSPEIAACL